MYRVERYLPDLLASLSAQRRGGYRLEVIFVDDGSPDASAELAREWLEKAGIPGKLIRQANGGVSSARNAGLDAATGDWVTFPDSDDLFDIAYFAEVSRFIRRHGQQSTIVSARLLRLREPNPRPQVQHALDFRFMAGDRVVPLDDNPDFFQLNVTSAFFRRTDLVGTGVRFRVGLHASEDALFTAEFLLQMQRPRLGLAAHANYIYRKRQAGDSAVDLYRRRADTYIERFRDGYAPLMALAASRGTVPGWLQSVFLYECQWIVPVQRTEAGYARVLTESQRAEVLAALGGCMRYVTEDRLFSYDATALPMESRLLLQAMAERPLPGWLGAYADPEREFATAYTIGDGHVRSGESRVLDTVVELPDYFGQSVLRVVTVRLPSFVSEVVVDGVNRPLIARHRFDSLAEQSDRHRRRVVGGRWAAATALAARERDVRVWKPISGPGGNVWLRLRRMAQVARRGRRKAARKRMLARESATQRAV